ncbi:unnamed protein product [Miscanthus lutarioriparius]|uniref:Uncharacterized protein n=1 Tax=Miscanthus lutarioriparius TaxID=422564 RepID=A0A811SFC2_9POAL|nr:unnamed protein product [Miscanthus lutarioriparius]
MRSKFVAAVILTAVVVMALVATSCSARPLVTGADAAGLGLGLGDAAVVSGKQILQLLGRLYLQQLEAEPSCQTNSSNGGCPPPSSG